MIHRTFILTLLGACAILTANLSCSDAGTDPPPSGSGSSTVSFANQIQPIFNNFGCTNCHGSSGNLSLAENQSHGNLVNKNAEADCTSLKRVLPGKADSSVLFKRVSSSDCGAQMPKGLAPLSPANINLIRDWINQGAPNN